MDYKKKVEYAERIAKELQGQKTLEQVKKELKAEGLYNRDVDSIMVSARKTLEDSYRPKIREFILAEKQVKGDPEFELVDEEMLDIMIEQEFKALNQAEKRKLRQSIESGKTPEEAISQINPRFLTPEQAIEQIQSAREAQQENSGSGRMFNILGGVGLIGLSGLLLVGTGRIFYVMPIIGLVMIGRGLMTVTFDSE